MAKRKKKSLQTHLRKKRKKKGGGKSGRTQDVRKDNHR